MMFAYVTVFYGKTIYLTGALVLGYSLMKTNTKFDRIILITPDVEIAHKEILQKVYTKVIVIDYIEANQNIFLENTRFEKVFTKLQCLSLTAYDKILLLDLDMIVCKNIDHLFQLDCPAACIKHFFVSYGKKIPSNLICCGSKLVGSINAGLMLLKPSVTELNSIISDINNPNINFKYKYPEQDYLSLRYCGQWTSITFNYNFQFGLTHRVKKAKYKIDHIYVIHYSSQYKPWNLLTENFLNSEEKSFIELHHKYYDIWIDAYNILKSKYNLPF